MEGTENKVDLLALLDMIQREKNEFGLKKQRGELRTKKAKKLERRRINLLVKQFNDTVGHTAISNI